MRSAPFRAVLFISAFFVLLPCWLMVAAQSRTNASGTGGIHEIRGKVYLPSGKTSDTPMEVELESISSFSSIKVITDREGVFSFRNLQAGNYTIIVRGGDQFEDVRESTTIDNEAAVRGTIPIVPIPKVITVPVYLQFKRGVVLRNDVINAKWSSVPKDAIDHFKRGADLVQENKTAEAEVELQKCVAIAPNFAPAHTELGKLALAEGKLELAVETLRRAIRYDESDFDAHLALGITFLNMKNYDLAESELVTAAYLNRYSARPHYYLGMLYVIKDNLDIAQKAFETARDLAGGKSLPALHKYLGRIYWKKDMEKEAIEELETYLKLVPKATDADKVKKDISDIKAKHVKNAFA